MNRVKPFVDPTRCCACDRLAESQAHNDSRYNREYCPHEDEPPVSRAQWHDTRDSPKTCQQEDEFVITINISIIGIKYLIPSYPTLWIVYKNCNAILSRRRSRSGWWWRLRSMWSPSRNAFHHDFYAFHGTCENESLVRGLVDFHGNACSRSKLVIFISQTRKTIRNDYDTS